VSLLRQLQEITERTYRQCSGVNLENFIIGRRRYAYLSSLCGSETMQLSDIARVFFRQIGNRLGLSIYFSNQLISHLELHDPRRGLTEKNIYEFIVFIEEINHGVHGAIKFLRGDRQILREEFCRDLELMAKIDSYQALKFFLACFNPDRQLQNFDRLWIKHHLFERPRFDYASAKLARRYAEANHLGEKYTRFLDGLASEDRVAELRHLQAMGYLDKKAYIIMLPS